MLRDVFLVVILPVLAIPGGFAQEPKATTIPDTKSMTKQATPAAEKSRDLSRFVNIQELQTISRFDYTDRGPGSVSRRDVQYRIRFRPQINVVPSGKTYLKMRAETGKGFANSWDYTGIGRDEKSWNFNVKTFALGQKLGAHMAVEVGGLEFEHGTGSQITYANSDSYLVGYRGAYGGERVKKISFTTGNVGDFDQQNFFRRPHLGKFNYYQVLVQGEFGRDIELSAQYSSIRDVHFLGQAASFGNVPGRIVDDIKLEMIERVSDRSRIGWAAILGRSLAARGMRGQLIYSDIPLNLYVKNGITLLQNQGEIDRGKRLSGKLSCKLGGAWEAGIWAGRRLDETPGKRWVVQLFLSHDFAGLLNRILKGGAS